MLTVYGRATSSNVQALLWAMQELGLSYERLDYGEVYGGLNSPEFMALTPHRRIPVLAVDGKPIWETPAILRYLAAEYGDDSFWPIDPMRRAQVDMWAEWAKHSVAVNFTGPVFWRTARTKPENRDWQVIRNAVDTLEAELIKAEARLTETRYLCGDELTLADIQLGHVLYRYFDIEISRRALPALRGYYDRLAKRPPYQNAVMVSYEALRNTF